MKKLLLILLCLPMIGFGQFTDGFSDGEFISNPAWLGDVGVFEIDTNNTLHLNDSIAGFSSLVTQSQSISNAIWEFSIRLDFSPSPNNFAKVYIVSDMTDLSGPLNGMYVKVGGQSGNIDDISLYAQTGTNDNEIIDGVAGLASNNPNISVKVTRDLLGNWELFLDTNGVFFSQGTAFDNSIINSDYFGVYCKYTVSRSDKFWFDNFSVSGGAISQQHTYVPDDNFENYLEANGMGDGIALNDSVFTASIDTLTALNVGNMSIADLTGIEGFSDLTNLKCGYNQLANIDLSQNTALTFLNCTTNVLTNIDVSQNTILEYLECGFNQLTSLDVSLSPALTYLSCWENQLTNLDVSQNVTLTEFSCAYNQLTSLDIRNGNNTNLPYLWAEYNPNLNCINVDNAVWSTANWTLANNNIDAQHYFSNNCSTTGIQEHTKNKELLKVTDLLGRETKGTKNEVLFYIYDDGTVEKRIVIE